VRQRVPQGSIPAADWEPALSPSAALGSIPLHNFTSAGWWGGGSSQPSWSNQWPVLVAQGWTPPGGGGVVVKDLPAGRPPGGPPVCLPPLRGSPRGRPLLPPMRGRSVGPPRGPSTSPSPATGTALPSGPWPGVGRGPRPSEWLGGSSGGGWIREGGNFFTSRVGGICDGCILFD